MEEKKVIIVDDTPDFRIDEALLGKKVDACAPAEPAAGAIVTNPTDPNTGAVLCPECGNGSVWRNDKGQMVTSPMRRIEIPGKVNALVHLCCGRAVVQKAFAHPAPAGSVPPPRGPMVSVEANVNNDQK